MTLPRRAFRETTTRRGRATLVTAGLVLAVAVSTCSPATDDGAHVDPGAVTTTDSAGVEIVRIGRDLLAEASPRVLADLDPRPVTDALVDEAAGRDRDRFGDAAPGSEAAMFLEILDDKAAMSRGGTHPVLGRMHASHSGRLLVRRMDLDEDPLRDGDPVHWDLFDPSGRLEGRLTLPEGTRIMQLTDEGLLAIERDEMDVPSVVRYRLEVGSGG